VASYEAVARRVGVPRATRAVGTAVGRNPVSYLIPCHRVIRKSGAIGNYGGGVARKQQLLAWEAAR
jgi:AraC family transcriptional regulator of adaptative response/methylated-DNA-[protein]-cysteine methyltransferase